MSADAVGRWLNHVNLGGLAPDFIDQEIDGRALIALQTIRNTDGVAAFAKFVGSIGSKKVGSIGSILSLAWILGFPIDSLPGMRSFA
eukprot:SAG31_NODE_9885_length_1215_cov_15.912186_1_plen_87_part_00